MKTVSQNQNFLNTKTISLSASKAKHKRKVLVCKFFCLQLGLGREYSAVLSWFHIMKFVTIRPRSYTNLHMFHKFTQFSFEYDNDTL